MREKQRVREGERQTETGEGMRGSGSGRGGVGLGLGLGLGCISSYRNVSLLIVHHSKVIHALIPHIRYVLPDVHLTCVPPCRLVSVMCRHELLLL